MRKYFFVLTTILFFCFKGVAQDSGLIPSLKQKIAIAKSDTAKANLYYELSKCYWYDYPDSAIHYSELSLLLSQKNNYHRGIAFANYSIGVSYVWKNDYFLAQQFTEKGLKIGELKGDSLILAYCYLNMGVIYSNLVKYLEAVKYFYAALAIADPLQLKEVQGWAYSNLASIFYNTNNKAETLRYDSLYFKNALLSGIKTDIALGYFSLGIIQIETTEYSEALKNLEKAIEFYKLSDSRSDIDLCYRYIAVVLRKQGKFHESLDYLFKEVKIAQEISDEGRMAFAYHEIGLAYQQIGNYTEAYRYYNIALPYGIKVSDYINVTAVYQGMVYVDSATGNFKQALANHKKYLIYNDSLKNTDLTKKITEQQMQYEFDKKQVAQMADQEKKDAIAKEEATQQRTIRNISFAGVIILLGFGLFTYSKYLQRKKLSNQLSQSLTELKQTQGQLIQLEKEKEAEAIRLRISRDIHDDIGSNLTKIAMLGNLASAQSKNKMPEMTEQLDKISDYARTVNSSMSEIIWAVNPKQDTLENLLAYMRVHTEEFLKDSGINCKINFPDNIPAIQLNPDLKRSLFLVLKESLNNVVKYAEAKNISVSFLTFETSFEMQIADDGKGFNLSEVNSIKGGNGLQNIKSRMEQSGCSLSIQTSPGNGCSVTVKGLLQSI